MDKYFTQTKLYSVYDDSYTATDDWCYESYYGDDDDAFTHKREVRV